jgi:hypothetical protein
MSGGTKRNFMPPLRDSLWCVALAILSAAWWVDHQGLAARIRNRESALSAKTLELDNWQMEAERLRALVESHRKSGAD